MSFRPFTKPFLRPFRRPFLCPSIVFPPSFPDDPTNPSTVLFWFDGTNASSSYSKEENLIPHNEDTSTWFLNNNSGNASFNTLTNMAHLEGQSDSVYPSPFPVTAGVPIIISVKLKSNDAAYLVYYDGVDFTQFRTINATCSKRYYFKVIPQNTGNGYILIGGVIGNNIDIKIEEFQVNTQMPVYALDKKVALLGDSITYGMGYPEYLQKLMPDAVITNAGVSADTTAQMIARYATDVTAHNPDNVIILGGINDIITSVPTTTIISNIASLYALHPNTTVIKILPFGGYAAWTQSMEDSRQIVNAYIATLNNIDLESVYASPNTIEMMPSLTIDALHPNEYWSGYMIADAVADQVFGLKYRKFYAKKDKINGYNFQAVEAPCATLATNDTISMKGHGILTGKMGTASLNYDGTNVTVTSSGTLFKLQFSDGTTWPICEGAGTAGNNLTVRDTTGKHTGTITAAASATVVWGATQDEYFDGMIRGYWVDNYDPAFKGVYYPSRPRATETILLQLNIIGNGTVTINNIGYTAINSPHTIINLSGDVEAIVTLGTGETAIDFTGLGVTGAAPSYMIDMSVTRVTECHTYSITNLVSNGDFSTGDLTDYSVYGTPAVTNGVCRITGAGYARIIQDIGDHNGAIIKYSFDLVATSGPQLEFEIFGTTIDESVPATYTGTITAGTSTTVGAWLVSGDGAEWVEVDNIKVWVA